MRPHKIDEKVAEHEQWLERLKRQPDPGQGLVPREAEKARQTHLKHIEGTVGELERLRSALPPEPDQYPATRAKQRVLNRRAIDAYPRSEAEVEGMRRSHEAMREQEHQRGVKSKIQALTEKRKLGPGHPQAASIVAAVMADPEILDDMHHRLRETKDGYHAFRALDIEDVGVLCTILHLLSEQGSVRVKGLTAGSNVRFDDAELPRLRDLGAVLIHLRKNGWLDVRVESGDGLYSYGPKVRKIAKRWGIKLAPPVKAEPEGVLTRS
jgi:hypothetical protein